MKGMALRGLLGPQHLLSGVVTRTVPVCMSVPLNYCSHERMWNLIPRLVSISFWALFCLKYEAFSSPGGPHLGKWRSQVVPPPPTLTGRGPSSSLGPQASLLQPGARA